MLASSIAWILTVSGAVTAVAGLTAFLFPRGLLRIAFSIESSDAPIVFFVRHWGVLIAVVGGLIAYSAYDLPVRGPACIAGAIEKGVLVLMILFGRLKRTRLMSIVALTDGLFAVLYVAYLAGL